MAICMSIRKVSFWLKDIKGLYRSAIRSGLATDLERRGRRGHARNGFKQVVDADRSLGGLGGFGIDALVVEITKVWSLDDVLIARQCDYRKLAIRKMSLGRQINVQSFSTCSHRPNQSP